MHGAAPAVVAGWSGGKTASTAAGVVPGLPVGAVLVVAAPVGCVEDMVGDADGGVEAASSECVGNTEIDEFAGPPALSAPGLVRAQAAAARPRSAAAVPTGMSHRRV